MTALGLARLQFGITTVFHFFFVPLTIGLAFLLALMETLYLHRGQDPALRKLLDFFGRLFLINFALGVVTGILQEFQFGMNWASYSRFVGDVFGAPLAVEALLAFFLESTFIGIWIFGWDRISPRLHALSMWLVAVGTTISAYWILTANAFMQEPVGYALRHGHAEMTNFLALLGNPQLWLEFPHVEFGALATGAFFMAGVSAYFLAKGRERPLFDQTFRLGVVVALVSTILTIVLGHAQAQHLVVAQPMKIAASEALWHTSPDHAPWTVFAIVDPATQQNRDVVAIPDLLSILAYNRTTGRVLGIDELQRLYQHRYGPGNYVPPVVPTFWSFRLMVFAGFVMLFLAAYGAYLVWKERHLQHPRYLRAMVWAIGLPYFANTMGWIMTEVGRQPWVVFGLQKTSAGVSPTVSAAEVWTTLLGFGIAYTVLAAVDVYLIGRYVRLGPGASEPDVSESGEAAV